MDQSLHRGGARYPPGYYAGRRGPISTLVRTHLLAESGVLDEVQVDLEASLTQVATLAVGAIRGADGAGVALLAGDQVDTIVASDNFVRLVDAVQYDGGQGPCVTAAAQWRTVCTGGLTEDREWPTLGRQAHHLGVESVLSLPLLVQGRVLGTINVYAHAQKAFDSVAVTIGEQFAQPAAAWINSAQLRAQSRRLCT